VKDREDAVFIVQFDIIRSGVYLQYFIRAVSLVVALFYKLVRFYIPCIHPDFVVYCKVHGILFMFIGVVFVLLLRLFC